MDEANCRKVWQGKGHTATFELYVAISAPEETGHRDSGLNRGCWGDYEITSYKINA